MSFCIDTVVNRHNWVVTREFCTYSRNGQSEPRKLWEDRIMIWQQYSGSQGGCELGWQRLHFDFLGRLQGHL